MPTPRLPARKKQRTGATDYAHYHRDGSLWAKGQMSNGNPEGYWEWFRKDGTKLRSGHFEAGVQVGAWTTYDKTGSVYKVTVMKPKKKASATG